MKRLFILAHDTARQRAVDAVTDAPEGYWVTISEPIKSRAQEEAYHSMISDIDCTNYVAEVCKLHGKVPAEFAKTANDCGDWRYDGIPF